MQAHLKIRLRNMSRKIESDPSVRRYADGSKYRIGGKQKIQVNPVT